MAALGLPPMSNHSSSQKMSTEKRMSPPDSKNSASNFASAFKSKVCLENWKELKKEIRKINLLFHE